MKKNTLICTILIVLPALIISCSTSTKQPSEFEILSSFENAIAKIVDQSLPAIVSLSITKEVQQDDKTTPSSSSGSGFIFKEAGYIITNEHVVNNAKAIRVRLYDGSSYVGKLVGGDQNTDIAVIKIEREGGFPHLTIANSENIRIGQFAIAIGHPIGYRYNVTTGIVGGKDRCFHPENKLFQYHRNYIQTDAWINKGSSGGPLLNIQGEVIGVTTLNPSGSTLAINVEFAKTIGEQLIKHGRVIRGYLDADMRNVSQGVKITRIKPNTSVSQCGLKRNDVIVEFDQAKVKDLYEFRLVVAECQIGMQYPIKVLRQQQEITLNVTVDEMPLDLVGRTINAESDSWKTLGLALRRLEEGNYHRYTYLTDIDRGLLVEKVKFGSLGYKAKIPRGSLITAINGQKINDIQTFETFIKDKEKVSEFILDIKNVDGTKKVKVILSEN